MTRYKSIRRGYDQKRLTIVDCRKSFTKASDELGLAYKRIDEDNDVSDDRASVLTTHGMLYRTWGGIEDKEESGSASAKEYRRKAIDILRTGLSFRSNNSHAAGALAGILIENCVEYEENCGDPDRFDPDRFAVDLGMAFTYLQYKPDPLFAYEWESNYKTAVRLCEGQAGLDVIARLKAGKQDLGWALDGLRILKGIIPESGSEQEEDIARYNAAMKVLGEKAKLDVEPSPLADLLRYAVYSALPENKGRRKFRARYELIQKLDKSNLMGSPVFLYDYAMLSFQVGNYHQGIELYEELRRGRKFLDVSLDRAEFLVDPKEPSNKLSVRLKVTKVNDGAQCWGITVPDGPNGLKLNIPFLERDFRTKVGSVKLGAVLNTHLNLRSAGPIAVPVSKSP